MKLEKIIEESIKIKDPLSEQEIKELPGFNIISEDKKHKIIRTRYKNEVYMFRYMDDTFKTMKIYKGKGYYLIGIEIQQERRQK